MMRTYMSSSNRDGLAQFALGMTGEAGEAAELVKKHLFHGHDLDRKALCEELGDVLWYVAALAHAADIPFDEVARFNEAKLRARYPSGFRKMASSESEGGGCQE